MEFQVNQKVKIFIPDDEAHGGNIVEEGTVVGFGTVADAPFLLGEKRFGEVKLRTVVMVKLSGKVSRVENSRLQSDTIACDPSVLVLTK